jgi:hypothetical protein
LDLNSLFDGWILAALLFAVLWPLLARLVSSEIGERAQPGRGTALFALAFFVLFDFARAVLHQRAIAQLDSRLYEDAPPLRTAALPEPFTPLRWTGVVEAAGTYRLYTVNTVGDLKAQAPNIFYKQPPRQSIENAKRTQPFRYFLYFARFPVWSEASAFVDGNPGTRIDLTDLRFGTPWAGSFHCIAVENSRKEVLRSWFTYGSGSDLAQGRR